MSAADRLAQVLAEHGDWGYGHGAFIRCDCGAHVGFPDDDGQHKGKRAHAAHVAAVVLAHLTAEGWAPGPRWQWETESVPQMFGNCGLPKLMRRRVTDWEPVETGDQE